MNNIFFAGITFKGLTKAELFDDCNKIKIIVPANSDIIVRASQNERFCSILNNNFTTFDGQIPYLMAKLKNKKIMFEKISGSDLIYDFCQYAKDNNKRIFLLGGYAESNAKGVEILKKKYRIKIRGYSPPYSPYPFSLEHNTKIIENIKKFRPDILFVGFGAMKQEFWIDDNKDVLNDIGVRWAIACGGTFEFVSCMIKRAPKLIQKIGLEGVYRFVCEPKWFRLKRLIISLKIFKYF